MLYYRTLQIYHLLFVGTFLCTVPYIIYKNGTCIYSLNQVRNKLSINETEVYI